MLNFLRGGFYEGEFMPHFIYVLGHKLSMDKKTMDQLKQEITKLKNENTQLRKGLISVLKLLKEEAKVIHDLKYNIIYFVQLNPTATFSLINNGLGGPGVKHQVQVFLRKVIILLDFSEMLIDPFINWSKGIEHVALCDITVNIASIKEVSF